MLFTNLISVAFAASALALPTMKRAEAPLVAALDKGLDTIGLGLDSTITTLVDALGLSSTDAEVDTVLVSLVGGVDSLVNSLDDVVDSLVDDLGLNPLVMNLGKYPCANAYSNGACQVVSLF